MVADLMKSSKPAATSRVTSSLTAMISAFGPFHPRWRRIRASRPYQSLIAAFGIDYFRVQATCGSGLFILGLAALALV